MTGKQNGLAYQMSAGDGLLEKSSEDNSIDLSLIERETLKTNITRLMGKTTLEELAKAIRYDREPSSMAPVRHAVNGTGTYIYRALLNRLAEHFDIEDPATLYTQKLRNHRPAKGRITLTKKQRDAFEAHIRASTHSMTQISETAGASSDYLGRLIRSKGRTTFASHLDGVAEALGMTRAEILTMPTHVEPEPEPVIDEPPFPSEDEDELDIAETAMAASLAVKALVLMLTQECGRKVAARDMTWQSVDIDTERIARQSPLPVIMEALESTIGGRVVSSWAWTSEDTIRIHLGPAITDYYLEQLQRTQ